MKISYDAEVDALSITFRETTVTTRHLAEGISVDYDKTVIRLQIDETDRRIDGRGNRDCRGWFALKYFCRGTALRALASENLYM